MNNIRTPSPIKLQRLLSLTLSILLLSGFGARCRADDLASATALIHRVLPERADGFTVEQIAPADGKDVFEVECAGGKVVLRGNTSGSVASTLNWYLKNIAQCDLLAEAYAKAPARIESKPNEKTYENFGDPEK